MSRKDPRQLIEKEANNSGFLLQLAIEREVRGGRGRWQVVAREHPWSHAETGTSGYLDLVIEADRLTVPVECKRRSGGNWVFIIDSEQDQQDRADCWWVNWVENRPDLMGASELAVEPSGYASEFCVVTGEGLKHSGEMLEKLGSELVRATEALSVEWRSLQHSGDLADVQVFLPIVVTTAHLSVCKVDVATIQLDSGRAEDLAGEEVPFVWFRKALTTRRQSLVQPTSLQQSHADFRRTVAVVSAEHVGAFLDDLRLLPDLWGRQVWQFVRDREAKTAISQLVFEGATYCWSPRRLVGLETLPAASYPEQLIDALREHGFEPLNALPKSLPRYQAQGYRQVFRTDFLNWRQEVLAADSGQLLLLRPKTKPW